MTNLSGKAEIIRGALIGGLLFGIAGALLGIEKVVHLPGIPGSQQRAGLFWRYPWEGSIIIHGPDPWPDPWQVSQHRYLGGQVRFEDRYNLTVGGIGLAAGLAAGLIGGAIAIAIGGVLLGNRGKASALSDVGTLGGMVTGTVMMAAIGVGKAVPLTFDEGFRRITLGNFTYLDGGAVASAVIQVIVGALAGGVIGFLGARGISNVFTGSTMHAADEAITEGQTRPLGGRGTWGLVLLCVVGVVLILGGWPAIAQGLSDPWLDPTDNMRMLALGYGCIVLALFVFAWAWRLVFWRSSRG